MTPNGMAFDACLTNLVADGSFADIIQSIMNTGSSTVSDSKINVWGNGPYNPFRYAGEYFDKETGLYYLRARYYDPTIGRFINEDPAESGFNWFIYCSNNPIVRIDSSGLKDYIYSDLNTYTTENEKKFFGIDISPTRYFIEVDGTRYQVNSTETVQFYFNANVDERNINNNFGDSEMYDNLIDAQSNGVSMKNIMDKSVGGYLDFKLQLNQSTIYNINCIYYNSNEAGNYMWSYLLRMNNYVKSLDDLLAQGGTIVASHRLDENWDAKARDAGQDAANEYLKLSKKYGVIEVLEALKSWVIPELNITGVNFAISHGENVISDASLGEKVGNFVMNFLPFKGAIDNLKNTFSNDSVLH